VRVILFVLLCQCVQTFMSYDGGATPASLDTIQIEMNNAWSASEFGILGAMDKIGMTASSIFWGRGLQLCNAKLLLCISLFLNTAATAALGELRSKPLMYASKFFMGATQALQGVWGTVWTVTMAPPERRTMWMGLGGVSAGVGNGIGTAVAGFGTANGLPYSFAFRVQAAVLALLWIYLLITPAARLATRLPKEARNAASQASTASEDAVGMRKQLRMLWANKVYCWTCLAMSLAMFVQSGIQFLWVRVFVSVWKLPKNFVTLMFLVVTGIGGGIGIGFGPSYVDKIGGFGTAPGVMKSLGVLSNFASTASLAGIAAIVALYCKNRAVDDFSNPIGLSGDAWLWLVWVAIFFMWGAHNACVPALTGINVEVVAEAHRTLASGTELTLRNILGFACGPLLPGILMDLLAAALGWKPETNPSELKTQLCWGIGFVFGVNSLSYFVIRRAQDAAAYRLEEQRTLALEQLREAFKDEDTRKLERAVNFARTVELQSTAVGAPIMGMADETIGQVKSGSNKAFRASATFVQEGASRAELLVKSEIFKRSWINVHICMKKLHC